MSQEGYSTLLSGGDLMSMLCEEYAKRLIEEYKGVSIPEVAALNNINLIYTHDQKASALMGERDGKRFIMLDPKRTPKQNEKQFYFLLAHFRWNDESKQ